MIVLCPTGVEGSQFGFRQGDLLTMLEAVKPEGASYKNSDWVMGIHEESRSRGAFPLDMVYILPTIDKPPKHFTVSTARILGYYLC